MKVKIKKAFISFLLVCAEFYLIYKYKQELVSLVPFLAKASADIYDDVFISFVGAVAFSVIEFFNYVVVSLIEFFAPKTALFVLQRICGFDKKKLHIRISQMIRFMFSTNCKWGVTQKTKVLKNANTAEGLIACADAIEAGIQFSDLQLNEIKSVLSYQTNLIQEDGYESFNENICTAHCTGMMLYAIKRFVDLELYEIKEDDEEKIRKCLKTMLKNSNEYGWGFINKKYDGGIYNRTLSTVWALRALNAWDFSDNLIFKKVIRNVVCQSNGMLGFSVDSTEKYSATAMLHILVHELKNGKLQEELTKQFDRKKVLSFLLEGLKYEVEVEEFLTSAETSKKLPWTHLSECMVLEAITLFVKDMGILQILKMSIFVKKVMNKIEINHNYYVVKSMNFMHSDPFFYPTTYLVTSLCKLSAMMKSI